MTVTTSAGAEASHHKHSDASLDRHPMKMLRTASQRLVNNVKPKWAPWFPPVNVPKRLWLARARAIVFEIFDNSTSSIAGFVVYMVIMFFIILSIVTFSVATRPDVRLRQEKGEVDEEDERYHTIDSECTQLR